jgi:thymidylate kinase
MAIIGMDKVKRFISDFERGERDNLIAKDIVFEMSKKYFEHSISVIVEQPFKSDDELKKYEDLAHKYSFPPYKIQLFTTPDLALERVRNRQKDWDDKCPEERVKRNISLFRNKGDNGFIAIDTSKISSDEVADKILEVLNS